MRFPTTLGLAVIASAQLMMCLARQESGDLALNIPPVKTSVSLEGKPVEITAWGVVSAASPGVFRLAMTVDLKDFQDNLTPILSAQLNKSDKCGERISVERAVLTPEAPGAILTAHLHYERFACAKALGKEIVKRLVGGNAVVEVNLTPSVEQSRITLGAQVRKIDADGSLGEVLRSGSFGDAIRQKAAASIESAIQKSANLKTKLPPRWRLRSLISPFTSPTGAQGDSGLLLPGTFVSRRSNSTLQRRSSLTSRAGRA